MPLALALCRGSEVGALCGSSAVSVADAVNHAPELAVVSSGTFSGRPCDPYAFRRLYPHKWRDFLKAHFDSAARVQAFFSIDEATARNWWHGKTGPQGWAVDYARQNLGDTE